MKKIFSLFVLLVMLGLATACDQGFDELNTNKVNPTAIDPAFQLNNAILNLAYTGGTLIYEMGIVQQVISPNSGVLTGANYNQDNRASTQNNWQAYYRNVVKNTRDVIERIENDPSRTNLLHMTRLTQAFAFMILTDTYGDIPYFQGGKGFTDLTFFPAYDRQVEIYADLIKEVQESVAGLSASGKIETADILFAGNIDKWKAFGNSFLLRLGMRLSEVDPTKAQQIVAQAAQGPLILTNADNALIRHDPNYQHPIGNTLNSTEAANFYLTEPFVNFLKSTSDPRLSAIAVRYVGAKSGPEQQPANASFDPALQIGMPMGNDNAGAVKAAASLGLASFYDFSQVDRRRISKLTAPNYLVTASQTFLLLAEARQRGWISTGTVAGYFQDGIRAHMNQLGQVDPNSTIAEPAIQAYLSANPFDPSTALKQINTQYWVSSFMNGPEAFANFRRSGFPVLEPNPFPGREVVFINRLTYPNSEVSVNKVNYDAAIAAQGPDDLATKVWWDK